MGRKLGSIALTLACLLAGCGSAMPTPPQPSPAGSQPATVDASAPAGDAVQTPASSGNSPSIAASPSQIDTTDWVPFTSDRYGYTVSYPPTNPGLGSGPSAPTTLSRAQRDFRFATDRFDAEQPAPGESPNTPVDRIVLGPAGSQIAFFGFAETIPAGTSVDDVISQSGGISSASCGSEPIMIDGQPGRFDVCGYDSIAVVIVGDRAFVFINGRGTMAKDLMKAQLSTVQLPTP